MYILQHNKRLETQTENTGITEYPMAGVHVFGRIYVGSILPGVLCHSLMTFVVPFTCRELSYRVLLIFFLMLLGFRW